MKRRRITITAFHRRTTVVLANLPERSRSKLPGSLEASEQPLDTDSLNSVRNSKTKKRRDDDETTDEDSDDSLSRLIDV